MHIIEGRFADAIEQAELGAAELDTLLCDLGYEEEQREEDPGLRYLRELSVKLRREYGVTQTLSEQLGAECVSSGRGGPKLNLPASLDLGRVPEVGSNLALWARVLGLALRLGGEEEEGVNLCPPRSKGRITVENLRELAGSVLGKVALVTAGVIVLFVIMALAGNAVVNGCIERVLGKYSDLDMKRGDVTVRSELLRQLAEKQLPVLEILHALAKATRF